MSAAQDEFVPDGRCVGMWDWSAEGIRCTGCGHRFSDICESRARHNAPPAAPSLNYPSSHAGEP